MSVAIFPNLRCPRNGTADEAGCLDILASVLARTPLKTCSLREGRKGCSASPDTGQQGGMLRERRVMR